MKTLLLVSTLLFHVVAAVAQPYWDCNLEPPSSNCASIFVLDTTHLHNSWQIGRPQKNIFDSAYTYPNAMVTDTINAYPVNDTSIFYIKHRKMLNMPTFQMYFQYKLDLDDGEIAKVEVSGDSGSHWIDVLAEDTTYHFSWQIGKPRLDTSTHEWKWFFLNMSFWSMTGDPAQNNFPSYITADTFLYRFTFISDANQTNKDGWMIDNFHFADFWDHVENISGNTVNIYPNPSNGNITIEQNHKGRSEISISIYNLQGQEVYHTTKIPASGQLQVSVPNGVYYLKYMLNERYIIKKISIVN